MITARQLKPHISTHAVLVNFLREEDADRALDLLKETLVALKVKYRKRDARFLPAGYRANDPLMQRGWVYHPLTT